MHDVLRGGKDDAQNDEERQVRQRGQPLLVDHPQTGLQQCAHHRERQRQAKARLRQKQPVPVGLHRQQGQRQVRHPEDDARAAERGAPIVENILSRNQPQKSRESRGGKGQFGGQHPRAVQVHDPHVGAQSLLLGAEERDQHDHQQGHKKENEGGFEFGHGWIVPHHSRPRAGRARGRVRAPQSGPRPRPARKFEQSWVVAQSK